MPHHMSVMESMALSKTAGDAGIAGGCVEFVWGGFLMVGWVVKPPPETYLVCLFLATG
jgi:hypothetical protein